MDFKLENKRVLVLGSSTGIGFAIAKAFADEGAIVGVTSREMHRAEEASEKIPGSMPFMCNLLQPSAGKQLVQTVSKPLALGGIDILVTNAGGPKTGHFNELKGEDWDAGYYGLWRSAIDAVHTVLPQMQERKWGRIIMCTSFAAKEPVPKLSISNGYRAGLVGVMKTVSEEVAADQITANIIMPGYTKTKRLEDFIIPEEELIAKIPAGRLGRPEEFAALATFLGSEQAAYITGQAIVCDGGLTRGL
ncbi:SDR family oxidoreductase [Simkania sp.]|uniref:SDR family oxidoreductase n=1 Tax=Simkania sp. TaxID=34094 RepID=UPI003B52A899